jgi:hypothetical protein
MIRPAPASNVIAIRAATRQSHATHATVPSLASRRHPRVHSSAPRAPARPAQRKIQRQAAKTPRRQEGNKTLQTRRLSVRSERIHGISIACASPPTTKMLCFEPNLRFSVRLGRLLVFNEHAVPGRTTRPPTIAATKRPSILAPWRLGGLALKPFCKPAPCINKPAPPSQQRQNNSPHPRPATA